MDYIQLSFIINYKTLEYKRGYKHHIHILSFNLCHFMTLFFLENPLYFIFPWIFPVDPKESNKIDIVDKRLSVLSKINILEVITLLYIVKGLYMLYMASDVFPAYPSNYFQFSTLSRCISCVSL